MEFLCVQLNYTIRRSSFFVKSVDIGGKTMYYSTSRQRTAQCTAALAMEYRISGWEKEQKVLDKLE